jgi:hypothetical protein
MCKVAFTEARSENGDLLGKVALLPAQWPIWTAIVGSGDDRRKVLAA